MTRDMTLGGKRVRVLMLQMSEKVHRCWGDIGRLDGDAGLSKGAAAHRKTVTTAEVHPRELEVENPVS